MSWLLVAVTVALPAAAGAVKSPLVLIVPAFADHVTAELKLPVPCTVALHCEVAFTPIVDGLHITATEVIVEALDCTVTVAVPDLVVSWMLVAVTVTLPAVAGAVKTPLALIVPALADHVTAELKLPVPCTAALHWEVALVATAEGLHVTVTDEILGVACDEVLPPPPPPPQAIRISGIPQTISVLRSGPGCVFSELRNEGLIPNRRFLGQESVTGPREDPT